ncbi:TetR family transcriptional regulator [Conyzicola nivalis]|uniref:TetR family transcriptional regulator n=1 Tax=Conyzicola nivalis TaxID=1477021 RepID=A0A916SJ92_9MICO|nr:TetR family transcriptional regulator [Conyzicola nivalis]GGB03031.1 TetR family transcriptional regulator [Conyzicola nivalis]
MGRWEPGARERLQGAALSLYSGKGFEVTTVAEIAQVAGLTERTFYRYFADKREVLFAIYDEFTRPFLDGIEGAPQGARPMEIMAAAVATASEFFTVDRQPYSRTRQSVIMANPELHERELLKLASLAATLATALRERGVKQTAATLAAEMGVTVYRVSFELWIADGETRPMAEIASGVFAELGVLTGPA